MQTSGSTWRLTPSERRASQESEADQRTTALALSESWKSHPCSSRPCGPGWPQQLAWQRLLDDLDFSSLSKLRAPADAPRHQSPAAAVNLSEMTAESSTALHGQPGPPISPRAKAQAPTRIYKPSGATPAPLMHLPPPLSSFSSPLTAPHSRLPISLLQSSAQMSFITEMSLLQAENLRPPHQTSLSSVPALFFSIILFTTSQTLFSLLLVSLHTLDHELHESKTFVYFLPCYRPSTYSAWHRADTQILILGINTLETPISKHDLYQKIIKELIMPKSLLHSSHLG